MITLERSSYQLSAGIACLALFSQAFLVLCGLSELVTSSSSKPSDFPFPVKSLGSATEERELMQTSNAYQQTLPLTRRNCRCFQPLRLSSGSLEGDYSDLHALPSVDILCGRSEYAISVPINRQISRESHFGLRHCGVLTSGLYLLCILRNAV